MENKYYTPEAEEFHVGFEYESLQDERTPEKESSWSKELISDEWEMRTFIGYYCGDHIAELRVKYLDKEDIESFGFTQITEGCFNLPIKEFRGRLNQEVRILVRDTILIYLAKDLDDKETYVLFTGSIKNKSELKKLLKQLNVK